MRGGDPNQFFDRLANGKDVITRADIANPMMQAMFDRMAQNLGITNGQITREQFTAAMQNFRGNRGQGTGPGNGQGQGGSDRIAAMAESSFQALDQNRDGLLNSDEMPEELRVERDKWDTNKDGFIDLAEYKVYFQARVQQWMADRNTNPNPGGGFDPNANGLPPTQTEEEDAKPVVYRAGNLPQGIPPWFAQLDTDQDGQIGLYEWKTSGRSIQEFEQMDRNGDGFLTIDEVMRYEAAQAKKRGNTPGGNVFALGGGGRPGGFGGFGGQNFGGGNGGRPNFGGGGNGGGPNFGPGNFGGRNGGGGGRNGRNGNGRNFGGGTPIPAQ
jgi:hypothetical protein